MASSRSTASAAAALLLVLAICLGSPAAAALKMTAQHTDRITETVMIPAGLAAGTGADDDGPARFSGFFKLDRSVDAHMFFFLFQSRSMKDDDPVVLWMTGGPGCSSELAVLVENGPWHVNHNMTLSETPYGWDVANTMIFVDQPINTGFSYSEADEDRVYDEVKVSRDMLDFLQELFKAHPELEGRDFYVTGESYAGHYVPAVSYAVWNATQNGTISVDIQLKGFAIGNGLTDPAIQYGAYADYALAHDLIDETTHDNVQWYYPSCRSAINVCNKRDSSTECSLAMSLCQVAIVNRIMSAAGNFNVYDVRLPCIGQLCYDFSDIYKFLNLPATRKWLGVGDAQWEECDMSVHSDMMGDWMKDYAGLLPPMLESGVRGLIYAGDQDFICNWIGNSRWVDALEWSGASKYNKTAPSRFSIDGEPAWEARTADTLTFMKVYDAGHMVPMDKPKQAMEMINKFTRNEPFVEEPAAAVRVEVPRIVKAAEFRRLGVNYFKGTK
eukprot:CAMPEP_0177770264 /NCGR_PEP_ID=MMETSP0491_2-20121128/10822_1 /TAXON_ID=63592 /ORGANISM="Tetraselmis chuii, Strain PLY429" /LENGTH=498 /DNA_ID=CAMNT_0019287447 /DNA_START=178 /DNA_END=1674 /DNA_ORIENTATION=+